MNLVIQDATVMISNGAFIKITHNFTVHLRQHVNLQLVMGSKCPIDTNGWAHFQGHLHWLEMNCIKLLKWIKQRQHTLLLIIKYSIIACIINPLTNACNVTLVNLQQRNLNLLKLIKYIEQLVHNILVMVDI